MVSAQKNKTFEQAQESQINYLKEALIKSSNQLDIQRETLAANFHDETGNLLSVIIHQAIQ